MYSTAADHICWHAKQLASTRGNSPVDPHIFSWEIHIHYVSQALYDFNVINNLHKLTKFQERECS